MGLICKADLTPRHICICFSENQVPREEKNHLPPFVFICICLYLKYSFMLTVFASICICLCRQLYLSFLCLYLVLPMFIFVFLKVECFVQQPKVSQVPREE